MRLLPRKKSTASPVLQRQNAQLDLLLHIPLTDRIKLLQEMKERPLEEPMKTAWQIAHVSEGLSEMESVNYFNYHLDTFKTIKTILRSYSGTVTREIRFSALEGSLRALYDFPSLPYAYRLFSNPGYAVLIQNKIVELETSNPLLIESKWWNQVRPYYFP